MHIGKNRIIMWAISLKVLMEEGWTEDTMEDTIEEDMMEEEMMGDMIDLLVIMIIDYSIE